MNASFKRLHVVSFGLLLFFALRVHAAIITTGNVTPDPSTTTSSSTLYIGDTSNGTMTVDGGSTVASRSSYVGNSSGVAGTATISGANSIWNGTYIDVGWAGTGTLNIVDGGTVSNSSITLGAQDSGVGTLNVLGAGSKLMTSYLEVGYNGSGQMNVGAGGHVVSTVGTVGNFVNSSATIDGSDSSWTIASSLIVGFNGQAMLTVQNGAKLSSSATYINRTSNDSATLTVAGAQTIWNNSGDVAVGSNNGQGTLKILQGSAVNVGGDTLVGTSQSPHGVIEFDSTVLNTGGLLAGNNSLHGNGTVNTHGLVIDTDLVYDAGHGFQKQIIVSDSPTQNIVINLDTSAAGSLGAGFSGHGSLKIADGIVVSSRNGYLGYQTGSAGEATVDGNGTKWQMTGNLAVGYGGSGSLAIQNGALIEVGKTTEMRSAGSKITFAGGTLTTQSLIGAAGQLSGSGNIRTHGLITDTVLVFDGSHPLQQQLIISVRPDQHVLIDLDANGSGTMGAGVNGLGTLLVADGVKLASTTGYLGYGLGSVGTATVTGSGSEWSIGGELIVGDAGVGNLTISDGAMVANADGEIGNGKVIVTGSGSRWNSRNISIGPYFSGPGELLILDGGRVTSVSLKQSSFSQSGIGIKDGSTGKVQVDGVGSTWVHTGLLGVGGEGTGTLLVTNGGSVTSAGGSIGNGLSSIDSGAATITGPDSLWNCTSNLLIGAGTSGKLTISNGGQVLSAGAIIGSSSLNSRASSATVTDYGSNWTTGGLSVGGGTIGTLMVTNGGTVVSTAAIIGNGSSSAFSSATIEGSGSRWSTANITIGYLSPASLTITNGGTVSSATGGIGRLGSVASTVNVSGLGSTWTTSSQLAVGGYFLSSSSPLFGGLGTLTIGADGNVTAGSDTTIFPKGKINLQGGSFTTTAIKFQSTGGVFNWTSGTLHVGTYNGNLTNSAGVLAPGMSPGKTTVTGNYMQQVSGSLQIEVGGTVSATQYDLLSVTGNVTLGGQLELRMLNGFLPVATDTFTVLTVGGTLSGAFSNVASGQRLATTDGLGSFLVMYSSSSKKVVLSAFEPVPEPDVIALVALAVLSNYVCTRRRISR